MAGIGGGPWSDIPLEVVLPKPKREGPGQRSPGPSRFGLGRTTSSGISLHGPPPIPAIILYVPLSLDRRVVTMPEPPVVSPSLRYVPLRDPRTAVDVFPGHRLRASRQSADHHRRRHDGRHRSQQNGAPHVPPPLSRSPRWTAPTNPYPEIREKARLAKRFSEATRARESQRQLRLASNFFRT